MIVLFLYQGINAQPIMTYTLLFIDFEKETCFDLYWIGVLPANEDRAATDNMFIRFLFASDTTANVSYEGWIIDDIRVGKGQGFLWSFITKQFD